MLFIRLGGGIPGRKCSTAGVGLYEQGSIVFHHPYLAILGRHCEISGAKLQRGCALAASATLWKEEGWGIYPLLFIPQFYWVVLS